ncbi:membrane protein [Clostridium botulinum]|uniref:Membrane protein n=2 Tax=Clostridium botulinum TaxID=1491 RepID=A0A9Q1UXY7_CLOBO|nr:conserved hypothetical protein [Clostridium botulinum BKT015925]KOA79927.1 membrane protein [Clostridium botulinum]MCD3196437.1 hypothetical protein [Clostridium botulinum C/D]KOA86350.1 membrane protein [Clostridium botulinum]KOA86979.1 membrane protein [Clostridium botulinum]
MGEDSMILTYIHYMYLMIISIIILAIIFRKDVTLICVLGVGLIGIISTHSILEGIKVMYKATVVSGKHFIDVVVIISIVNSMAKALSDIGADKVIISPIKKFMTNKTSAFFVLGFTNIIMSWFLWPTPAVVFVGAIMVPAAVEAGLPIIWVAVVMSLFGKGVAFSSDFFIQGTPSITARSAGISNTFKIIKASFPFWLVMSAVTILTTFFIMKKDTEYSEVKKDTAKEISKGLLDKTIDNVKAKGAKIVSLATILGFLVDIIVMSLLKISGDEATALIGSTSILILILTCYINYKFKNMFEYFTQYVRDGFIFGMKVFSPIIIIGSLFFLGSKNTAQEILGLNATGLLTDIGMYVSQRIHLSKITAIVVQGFTSILLGISGSGVGGIPLVGTLADTFSKAIDIDLSKIAAFGQVITVWIGGGTIIPWSVLPVSSICDVSPFELARKNLIPVGVGLIATFLFALVWI